MASDEQNSAPGGANPRYRSRAAESIHRRLVGLVKSLLTRKGQETLDGLPNEI